MDFKKILLLVVISSLLVGCAFATGVSDFKVNDTYKNLYSGPDYSVYANDNQDSGINIYKNIDDTHDNDTDVLDNVIHDDGREYITPDDDLKLDKNADYTANFTDMDHGTHGISEVVEVNGTQYVIVVWAKDSSSNDFAKLLTTLTEFNKDNNVKPISF